MKKVIILSVAVMAFILSCKHEIPQFKDEIVVGNGGGTNPYVSPCDPDSVYFEQQILPLFQSNCAQPGCHDAIEHEEGFIFDSYANIMASGEITPYNLNGGDIYEVITENDPSDIMPPPPNAPLTTEQINLIADWILQGAQNNSCADLLCDTLDVTFNLSVLPLVTNSCSGCHSGASPDGNLLLTNYSQIAASASNGSLIDAVYGTNGVPLMPYNGTALSDCAIRTLEIWIENGALND